MFQPIVRYFKGYDPALLNDVIKFFTDKFGGSLSPADINQLGVMLQKHEFAVPFAAMPITEGVQHVRFLLDMVISHHRFAIGAPVVGGRARIGKVTYAAGKFEIMETAGDRRIKL